MLVKFTYFLTGSVMGQRSKVSCSKEQCMICLVRMGLGDCALCSCYSNRCPTSWDLRSGHPTLLTETQWIMESMNYYRNVFSVI